MISLFDDCTLLYDKFILLFFGGLVLRLFLFVLFDDFTLELEDWCSHFHGVCHDFIILVLFKLTKFLNNIIIFLLKIRKSFCVIFTFGKCELVRNYD